MSESLNPELSEAKVTDFGKSDIEELKKKVKSVTLYAQIEVSKSMKEWKKAKVTRSLGYNGQSSRSKRRQAKDTCN